MTSTAGFVIISNSVVLQGLSFMDLFYNGSFWMVSVILFVFVDNSIQFG